MVVIRVLGTSLFDPSNINGSDRAVPLLAATSAEENAIRGWPRGPSRTTQRFDVRVATPNGAALSKAFEAVATRAHRLSLALAATHVGEPKATRPAQLTGCRCDHGP